LLQPAVAQFGVAGKKKQTSFQDLNEQAKAMQDNAGMPDAAEMEKMLAEMGLDDFGGQMDEVMKMMAQMSPEELEAQMQEAMEQMMNGDMLDDMLKYQDEIIKSLEEGGTVSEEEIAKMKTDPEYFEQKMKESFEAMDQLFKDPDAMEAAKKGIQGVQQMINNPGAMNEMMREMFSDDEKIEEVRQMLLNDPEMAKNSMLKDVLADEENMAILRDPVKFRESLKEATAIFDDVGAAGVGEL